MQINLPWYLWILLSSLLVSSAAIIGWMGFLLFGDLASRVQVVLVSKQAIVQLEKERIKENNQDMFFGKPEEAINLINKASRAYIGRKVKLVFVGDNIGNCYGGRDISKQVHSVVIAKQLVGAGKL